MIRIMTNRYISLLMMVFIFALTLGDQARAQNCNVDYELIFKMDPPSIGSYNVWDALYGEQDTGERLVSGVFDKPEMLITVGERFSASSLDVKLIMVGLGRNGRMKWEKSHEIKGLRSVVKMLPMGGHLMVLANAVNAKGVGYAWLGKFDKEGALIKAYSVKDRKSNVSAQDIIPAHDGKNFMLVTHFVDPSYKNEGRGKVQGQSPHAVIYKITPTGKVIFGPAFLPGAENKVLSIAPAGDNYYIATGYIRSTNGRKAGWVMRLNEQAGVDWQRQYSRGSAAEINKSAELFGRYVIVAGVAKPSDGHDEGSAGWVMAIGADSGDIGWQRYYTGDADFSAEDLMINEDGLISVMLEGQPNENFDQDYVRLLTINPRGQLFISDEYFNGEGTDGAQLISGANGERVIIGSTKMAYQIEDALTDNVQTVRSVEGWVLVGAASDPYSDPCIRRFSPQE